MILKQICIWLPLFPKDEHEHDPLTKEDKNEDSREVSVRGDDEEDKEINCLKEQLKLMKEENVRLETLNDEKQKKLRPPK